MSSFERSSKASVSVKLDEDETELLRGLVEQLRSLLGGGLADDPVNKRLFPDAYESGTDETAYRELVGADLERHKLDAVERVASKLQRGSFEATLEPAECETWLVVLTDLRLALGTRLEVTEETMSAEIDPDDAESASLAVLHWLGWLQESLLDALQSK